MSANLPARFESVEVVEDFMTAPSAELMADLAATPGDIMVLGAASYASPLLSTLVLVIAGFAPFTWPVLAACLLITLGAVIAAKDMLFKRKPAT